MKPLRPASILPAPLPIKIRTGKEKSRFYDGIDRFETDLAIPPPAAYETARETRGQNINQDAAAMATP